MTHYSSKEYLAKVDAWWRAANFISVGQLYLKDNPLLKRKLEHTDLKVHPIGHWGTISGQNFIYAHLNRVINKYDLDMFYIEGPGHGGQVMVSNSYLDGSYTELYPHITEDLEGLKSLYKQFSFPGGIASHAAPETPGSIHEGGELGYSLSHAVGAILDNPDTIAATVIGDGEAETGPLAASWFSNVFINPVNDGAVLPILYLNGFKISNPTILSRKSNEELKKYFEGMGWKSYFVECTEYYDNKAHEHMANQLDLVIEDIKSIQRIARRDKAEVAKMPNWPVLIVRTPKGWTGPKEWDGEPIEGSFRAHQVPIPVNQHDVEHIEDLLTWLNSYRPEELFTEDGKLKPELKNVSPQGGRRMSMNPVTNGGINPRKLDLPDWTEYAVKIKRPGDTIAQDMIILGEYTGGVVKSNPDNFRVFAPDEAKSNRLNAVFKVTNRQWLEDINNPYDEWQSAAGRVIDSQLSEHQVEGFLEGYVLTGRHGFFASYESFLRVVDSMLTQHFKWLRKASEQTWRSDYPSLNIVATSTVFQQDHNGYTHQDPGILTHLSEKKSEFIREYLPADANSLLSVMDKALASRNKINLIVASKHPRPQFYNIDEARELVERGLKIIDWASTEINGQEPDAVIVAAGTEPNLEALASISIVNKHFKDLKLRFINVVDLLKLRHESIDPRGMSDEEFDIMFTKNKPIIFAFHGYEGLIRDIFFKHNNHNLFVHGYRENGDITTPFDMRVLNEMDRFHLAKEIVQQVRPNDIEFIKLMDDTIAEHHRHIREYGNDLPEVNNWKWQDLNN